MKSKLKTLINQNKSMIKGAKSLLSFMVFYLSHDETKKTTLSNNLGTNVCECQPTTPIKEMH